MYLQDSYQKAINFAAYAHKDQKIKGKNYTYIVHLSNTAMEVIYAINTMPVDNPQLAVLCGILHDTIEDTDINYEQIKNEFGVKIADGVLALTKDKKIDKDKQIKDSLNRIKKQPKEIWVVKIADRITNLQEPPLSWTKEKIKSYLIDAELIYNELKDAHKYIADRLKIKIDQYKKYSE